MDYTTKTNKKQSLRNNEYYSAQKVMDDLYNGSKNGENFTKLYELITSENNILLAYRNTKNNTGRNTSGTDGRTIKYLNNLTSEDLINLVRNKLRNYQPQKVKRVNIPKTDGKTRPLGIPTITDRLVQQSILQILEPICEAKFAKHSYGFRPLRSAKHAIARAYFLAQQANLHCVVDVDIKGFFDNINHGKLLKQIWAIGIRDKRVISIISKLLKAEIEGEGIPEKGTPQGGIISPLLANIALNEFDHWIESQWAKFPNKITYTRNDTCKKSLRNRSNLKEVYIVRYADDFKLFCRKYDEAVKLFEATKDWLDKRLHLSVNEDKSKIINLKKQYSDFLGIKFKVRIKGKTAVSKKPIWVIESHICDKAYDKILNNVKSHIKNIQYPRLNKGQMAVNKYNEYIFGVHSYYDTATHVNKDFGEISYKTLDKFKTRLKHAKKQSDSQRLPQYINKYYGKSKQIRYMYNTPIIPVGYVQHTISSFQYKGYSPYVVTDREKIHKELEKVKPYEIKNLMENRSIGQSTLYNDNRISLFVAQQGKCAIAKKRLETHEVHCHHKIPKHLGGSDEYNNLIIVCEEIHHLIHSTVKRTIEKNLNKLNLGKSELEKVNQLRKLANLEIIS